MTDQTKGPSAGGRPDLTPGAIVFSRDHGEGEIVEGVVTGESDRVFVQFDRSIWPAPILLSPDQFETLAQTCERMEAFFIWAERCAHA